MRIIYKILGFIEIFLKAIKAQFKQNECQKFSDNIKLYWLLYRAPKYFDRDLEYPWVIKHIDIKEGKLLDIGSTVGIMLKELLPQGLEIYCLDLNVRAKIDSSIKFSTGDVRSTDFKDNLFNTITCISTLEHVGVEGRYKVKKDEFGDIKAMKEMLRILKPGGKLVLTVPYGAKDMLPFNKLYNKERLSELFKGYNLKVSEYLRFNSKYKLWLSTTEADAATTDWNKEPWYALGLFILEKPSK